MNHVDRRGPAGLDTADEATAEMATPLPDYLVDTYRWAYLTPRFVRLLDNQLVVSAILFGNYRRLVDATLDEFRPGQSVWQAACAYGDLSPRLARHLTPTGQLTVSDVAPLQVENCRLKVSGAAATRLLVHDAAEPWRRRFDGVCCFFLLHELPGDYKRRTVNCLLDAIGPGGKVVFVDYHRPHRLHPLRPLISQVFRWLEPFAQELTRMEISDLATAPDAFRWRKKTWFGGLYQTVVAERRRD